MALVALLALVIPVAMLALVIPVALLTLVIPVALLAWWPGCRPHAPL